MRLVYNTRNLGTFGGDQMLAKNRLTAPLFDTNLFTKHIERLTLQCTRAIGLVWRKTILLCQTDFRLSARSFDFEG
jgi:hypothetical protein